MTERESLEQRSLPDLVEIAVAFNLVSREDAAKMDAASLRELIAPDDKSAKTEEKPKKTTRKTKTAAKASESETVDVPEKTEKTEKAEKTEKKKITSRKTTKAAKEKIEAEADVKTEETAEAKADEKPKAKRGRTSKAKTAEEVKEEKKEEAPAEEAETEETETKSSKKPSKEKKTTRSKKTGTKDKTPLEQMAEDAKAPSEEVKASEPSEEVKETKEEPKEQARPSEEGKKPEQRGDQRNRKQKGKKRTLSFGTSKEDGSVIVTEVQPSEVAPSNNEQQVQEIQEPQYIEVEGVLSIGNNDKGDFNGFIHRHNYLPGEEDAFVQGQLIRRLGLRRGDYIKGLVLPQRGKEKYAPLKKVISVNGIELGDDPSDIDKIKRRKRFETLTAIYPDERLKLETTHEDISTRIIDLFCPIGKGQRGMIVSPPKAGKTVLLKKVANSITANNPKCKLIVLLIDERPEEVTDMQRSIKGEVVYSTFDKRPENHVRVTELVLERAMRLVELGEDVVILLDSMTRLARAYNLTINPTGRTLSGGLDPGSLYGPKRFFGAARNIENGGSLTIIATALIETGSRMDEVIFEEFKGTGNMEVTLDRKLADRRVFPAIAVDKSGTRREDLLLSPEELEAIWLLRKRIADVDTIAATDAVINFMQKTTTNTSFVLSIKKSFSVDE